MSRYDGLIIPRSYNEYINKTDAVAMLQALQLNNVMDAAPTAGSNRPVKSSGLVPIDNIERGEMRVPTSNAVENRLNPSVTDYHGQNTQVFKIDNIAFNNYFVLFFAGYLGNIGSVVGYVQRSDLTFRKFDGTDLGTDKPTITLNTTTQEISITATGGGVLLEALGARHLRWE